MTCIVATVSKNMMYMAGDCAGVDSSYNLVHRRDKKIAKVGDFLIGFTTSFRMGQLLIFGFNPPIPKPDQDLMDFMVNDFIGAVRIRLKEGGFTTVKDAVEEGGEFLVAYQGRIFHIHDDFQVEESVWPFAACGCGEPYAKSAMYVLHEDLHPKILLDKALNSASTFSAGVSPPFHHISLGFNGRQDTDQ